jgi:regulatory protein
VKDQRETAGELRARALRLLARRDHSRAELERKLGPHAGSSEVVAAIVEALVQKKQLSDERYAEERTRSLSRKYGAAKIRGDLKAKGVDQDVINRVSTEHELERAVAILRRKFRAPAASREEHARRARFLQSRGFSYEIIRSALGLSSTDTE